MMRIDEPRINLGEAIIIESEFRQATDFEVLDQDIRIRDHRFQGDQIIWIFEIAGHRLLTAIGGVEIGRDGFSAALGQRAFQKGRAPLPCVIAFWRFDLDNLCPEIRKRLADPRAGQNTGEFDDFQALERRISDGINQRLAGP